MPLPDDPPGVAAGAQSHKRSVALAAVEHRVRGVRAASARGRSAVPVRPAHPRQRPDAWPGPSSHEHRLPGCAAHAAERLWRGDRRMSTRPPNSYLPPRSGCVTVRRADVVGNGRQDLILLYSLLSHRRAGQLGATTGLSRMYEATEAMLGIMTPGANSIVTRVDHARAAALLAVAHVNDDPGDELFIQVSQISSGATAIAYAFHDGGPVPQESPSRTEATQRARPGSTASPAIPRLVQRRFELIGPTIHERWSETRCDLRLARSPPDQDRRTHVQAPRATARSRDRRRRRLHRRDRLEPIRPAAQNTLWRAYERLVRFHQEPGVSTRPRPRA